MKDTFLKILLLLLCCSPAGAQTLPSLPDSKAVSHGHLVNGASYYIVGNTVSKGYADFALIQKNIDDTDHLRLSLNKIECFGERPPYMFLASKGVGYSKEGMIRREGQAGIFSLRDVPVFDRNAADSTLIVLTEMMKTSSGPQCIIISGDINKDSMLERLNILSMLTGKLPDDSSPSPYVWSPAPGPTVEYRPAFKGSSAGFRVRFFSERTPAAVMGTTQPLVTRMFANALTTIVRNRARETFNAAGIPLASIKSSYLSSSSKSGDEILEFTVVTEKGSLERACGLFSSLLGDLDSKGATLAEYQYAKDRFILRELRNSSKSTVSNSDYVSKCTSAYLYGASLAEESAITDFFVKRKLSSETEVGLFNSYVSAVLNPDRAVELAFEGNDGRLENAFRDGWKPSEASEAVTLNSEADTLKFIQPKRKVKLKTESVDPITGGKLWVFSNGMKVVYKNMATKGCINYAYVLRGGAMLMPGLKNGEAPFLGSLFDFCSIRGMSPSEFRKILIDNGITMKCNVSASDMRISGSAPGNRLDLVLKALISLGDSHDPDPESFNYFRRCEALKAERFRKSEDGLIPILDSLRRPMYPCLEIKNPSALGNDFPARAKKYYDTQFSRSNDGVLVIIGDIPYDAALKSMMRTLSGFQTSKTFAARPKTRSGWRDGWYTITWPKESAGPGTQCACVEMSAGMPFTMDKYMTLKVASLALERAVTDAVAPLGMRVVVDDRTEFFPTEQFSVCVRCFPVNEEGLPEGIAPGSIRRTLNAVRSALLKVSRTDLRASVLAGYKEEVTNRMASECLRADFLLEESAARYSTGKDNVSGYATYIKGVTAEGVRSILRALDDGEKTELVLQ